MSQRKSGGRRAKGFYDPSLVGKLLGFCLSLGVLAYKGVKRLAKKIKSASSSFKSQNAIRTKVNSISLTQNFDYISCYDFECYVAKVYANLGYTYDITPKSGDKGADIILTKDNLKTAVQVKKYTGRVGVAAVQEVYAAKTYYNAVYAIVVTNSYFTKQARELAAKLYVTLVDRDKLIALQSSAVKQETINDKIVEKQEKISKIIYFSMLFTGLLLAVIFFPLYNVFEQNIFGIFAGIGTVLIVICIILAIQSNKH